MSAPYTFNFNSFFGPLVQKWQASPTNGVRQTAQMVHVFQLMTVTTDAKLQAQISDIETRAITQYQMMMAGFLPRFVTALVQEQAIWTASHPTATPEEQAAFAAQQAQTLADFMQQLTTWHDEFVAALTAALATH
jgi:hypothetical protein